MYLLTVFLVASLITNSVDRQIYQPFIESDFGKVNSLTCIRKNNLQIDRQKYQVGVFKLTSSIMKFQLLNVSIEEYAQPESSSSYLLHLSTNTSQTTIDYDRREEAQSAFIKIKELLAGTKESLFLRYEDGFVRRLIAMFLSGFLLVGYFTCFGSFLALLQSLVAFSLNR